ncbi:MAG: site-specific integrase [Proteobacteria bacterium]|nr:site-specific integrase [Pseudomonadota bacterium]
MSKQSMPTQVQLDTYLRYLEEDRRLAPSTVSGYRDDLARWHPSDARCALLVHFPQSEG